MPKRIIESIDALAALVGQEVGVSDYVDVTQERIDRFAATTGDDQWIHVDPERARRESPYKGTIAHGFLTLSMLSLLVRETVEVRGVRMGINYGLDRVRFPAAVPSGSRIRAHLTLGAVEPIDGGIQAKWSATVVVEGATKPSCAAEWLVRYYR